MQCKHKEIILCKFLFSSFKWNFRLKSHPHMKKCSNFVFYFLYSKKEENIGIMKIFDFRFLTDLQVLDVLNTISLLLQNICLSLGLSVYVWYKFCGSTRAKSKAELLEILHSVVPHCKLVLIRNRCIRSRSSAVVRNFWLP